MCALLGKGEEAAELLVAVMGRGSVMLSKAGGGGETDLGF